MSAMPEWETLTVATLQVLSICGALLIIVAYIANQMGYLGPERAIYSVINLVGSVILAAIAALEAQWGFLLLEGVWAVVSALSLARLAVSGRSAD